jgi:hypothetical protein
MKYVYINGHETWSVTLRTILRLQVFEKRLDIWIFDLGIGWEGMDWIDLAQDRGRWWAVLNMVMNIWVL